jgi:hypothetical protein
MNRTDHSSSIARISLFVAFICTPAFALQSDLTTVHLAPPTSGSKEGIPRNIPANAQTNPRDSVLAPAAGSGSQRVMQESWTAQQGAPEYVVSMAQTADGFLWLEPQRAFSF